MPPRGDLEDSPAPHHGLGTALLPNKPSGLILGQRVFSCRDQVSSIHLQLGGLPTFASRFPQGSSHLQHGGHPQDERGQTQCALGGFAEAGKGALSFHILHEEHEATRVALHLLQEGLLGFQTALDGLSQQEARGEPRRTQR